MPNRQITEKEIFLTFLQLEEKLVASSIPLLFFLILSIIQDQVQKKKISKLFLRLFDNPLSKQLIFKSCLLALVVLCYLPKLKRGLSLVFGAHFLNTFSTKNFPRLIVYHLTRFQDPTLFPSEDIKQYVFLHSCLPN